MKPVKKVEGRAIPFGNKNVDTDVIIPASWLKTISREELDVVKDAVGGVGIDAVLRTALYEDCAVL